MDLTIKSFEAAVQHSITTLRSEVGAKLAERDAKLDTHETRLDDIEKGLRAVENLDQDAGNARGSSSGQGGGPSGGQ